MRWADLDAGDRKLVETARDARRQGHAPYSGFKVGAAVRTRDGHIFAGCNVENASLGASICAERGAVMQAVVRGMRRGKLDAVAVYTRNDEPTPPCGMCLQVLSEFAHDPVIFLANARRIDKTSLRELLARPFTSFPRRPA